MPVPAVDLSELVSGKPAPERLSTRIIVVNQHAPDGSDQLAGLIAEEATELLRKDPREFADPAINLKRPASLGPITLDTNRSIRWLRQDRLLPDSIRSFLCSRGVMPKPVTDLTDSSVLEL
jgi:chemotaxis-related protein WspB